MPRSRSSVASQHHPYQRFVFPFWRENPERYTKRAIEYYERHLYDFCNQKTIEWQKRIKAESKKIEQLRELNLPLRLELWRNENIGTAS